ncbi:unnamed protein product [Protopolystoma xenopodis]|uniref:Uncharacterized protein n=1 Tax=Protopolystoma xenopodis TaxID=117903 RepID=A0A448WKV1_9PLAT|nr:unnamed protein product [Protopolystoma xenopodis]
MIAGFSPRLSVSTGGLSTSISNLQTVSVEANDADNGGYLYAHPNFPLAFSATPSLLLTTGEADQCSPPFTTVAPARSFLRRTVDKPISIHRSIYSLSTVPCSAIAVCTSTGTTSETVTNCGILTASTTSASAVVSINSAAIGSGPSRLSTRIPETTTDFFPSHFCDDSSHKTHPSGNLPSASPPPPPARRCLMAGGRLPGWTPEAVVACWRRFLGLLGDVNTIRPDGRLAEVHSYLAELTDNLLKVHQFQALGSPSESNKVNNNVGPFSEAHSLEDNRNYGEYKEVVRVAGHRPSPRRSPSFLPPIDYILPILFSVTSSQMTYLFFILFLAH